MRHPIRRYRAWTARRRTAASARARYHQLDAKAAGLMGELARTATHPERHMLLAHLSRAEADMAAAQRAGWGRVPNPDEGGRDLSESLALSGVLLRLVSDAERALAYPPYRRHDTTTHLERTAGPVLDAAVEAGRIDRAVLDALHTAVYPVVGGQAAEAIACLPLPGGRGDYKLTG
jgi:hypothetical protein